MSFALNRRRFLGISACALVMPGGALASRPATWRGAALGAPASMRLEGVSEAQARPVFAAVAAELERLEGVFSLFRPGSALRRLNGTGRLDAPPPDLLEVLALSDRLNLATDGAFDPTVQALWRTHADALAGGTPADRDALTRALENTGWQHLRFDATAVSLEQPGMALTLNGVAQGYITDRIASLLLEAGFRDTLIDMGEIAASGVRGDGAAWQAGVADPGGALIARVTLRDRALATSSPGGTVLDASGTIGHIFDPHTGDPAKNTALVSVSAPDAALADGLSTALCLLPDDEKETTLSRFPGARLETLR